MEAKHDIIQATEQEYAKLRAAVHGLGEAQMREVWLGTWGVREIIAHIAGWHGEMLPALERVARGEPPYAQGTYDDFDRWNARFVEARKDVATDDLLRERSEEHTSELQSRLHIVCRLLLGKKKERFMRNQGSPSQDCRLQIPNCRLRDCS